MLAVRAGVTWGFLCLDCITRKPQTAVLKILQKSKLAAGMSDNKIKVPQDDSGNDNGDSKRCRCQVDAVSAGCVIWYFYSFGTCNNDNAIERGVWTALIFAIDFETLGMDAGEQASTGRRLRNAYNELLFCDICEFQFNFLLHAKSSDWLKARHALRIRARMKN